MSITAVCTSPSRSFNAQSVWHSFPEWMFYVSGSSSFQRMGSAGSCSWFPCRREGAGCVSSSPLALEAVKVRLLWSRRGAADFFRRCSLLHGYCSYPPGTRSLLFLLLRILYMDPPALSRFFFHSHFIFIFLFYFVQVVPLCPHPPPCLFYYFFFSSFWLQWVRRMNCSSLCLNRNITSSTSSVSWIWLDKWNVYKLFRSTSTTQ